MRLSRTCFCITVSLAVCGLFIVGTEMSELAELFQLNISLLYAGFIANNITHCRHVLKFRHRKQQHIQLDFQVERFSPGTL